MGGWFLMCFNFHTHIIRTLLYRSFSKSKHTCVRLFLHWTNLNTKFDSFLNCLPCLVLFSIYEDEKTYMPGCLNSSIFSRKKNLKLVFGKWDYNLKKREEENGIWPRSNKIHFYETFFSFTFFFFFLKNKLKYKLYLIWRAYTVVIS